MGAQGHTLYLQARSSLTISPDPLVPSFDPKHSSAHGRHRGGDSSLRASYGRYGVYCSRWPGDWFTRRKLPADSRRTRRPRLTTAINCLKLTRTVDKGKPTARGRCCIVTLPRYQSSSYIPDVSVGYSAGTWFIWEGFGASHYQLQLVL
jgi:hypothetical protein